MANSWWKWWLGAGATGVVLYIVLPGTVVSDLGYMAYGLSVPIAILIGVRHFRPTPRAPWFWLAAAHGMLFVADVIWFVLDWLQLTVYPSAADVLYMLSYPCTVVGLV